MLKKYSPIDVLFVALCTIFIALSIFELIRFLIPLYTYMRAILSIVCIAILYAIYNLMFRSTGAVRKRTVSSNDTAAVDTSAVENPVVKIIYAIYNFTLKHRDSIVYTSFIVVALLILMSQIVNVTVLTVYAMIAFALIYLYARMIGFKLDTSIRRSSLRSFNTLRFFTILYAVFFVILSYLIDIFQVPAEDKSYIFIGTSLLYIISGAMIFFDISKIFAGVKSFVTKRLLRPYPIFMTILILGLTGYLAAKNNLVEQIGEGVASVNESIEESGGIVLPGVVNNEVVSEVDSLDEESVEYETVLVSSRYDIETGLALESVGQGVIQLQTVLGNLQYYLGEVNGDFDIATQGALIEALRTECAWPDTTRGIFGPQAKECIDNLEITLRVESPEPEQLISDEILIN